MTKKMTKIKLLSFRMSERHQVCFKKTKEK